MTQLPQMPDLSTSRTNLTPWWQWFGLALATFAAILIAVMLSRQSGHIASNAATAKEVQSISSEVREVKTEVLVLRDFVDHVQAEAERKAAANAERIEQVQEQASDRADVSDTRADASDARQDARDDPETP